MDDLDLQSILGNTPCAECRRSRVKCDRIFPCSRCVKKGCGHLCPSGTAAPRHKSQMLKALVQDLRENAKSLELDIVLMEQELARLKGPGAETPSSTAGSSGDSSTAVDTDSITSVVRDFSPMAPRDDRPAHCASVREANPMAAYFEGFMMDHESPFPEPPLDEMAQGIPPNLVTLAKTFPFGDPTDSSANQPQITMLQLMACLPDRKTATALADAYYTTMDCALAFCVHRPLSRGDLAELLEEVYGDAGRADPFSVHPHRLALLCMVLCLGALPARDRRGADRFYTLARAAGALRGLHAEAGLWAFLTLFFMSFTELRLAHPDAPGRVRALLALCESTAARIGLHVEPGGLGEEELERRRFAFWEWRSWAVICTVTKTAKGLVSMISPETGCRRPTESGNSFHAWKYSIAATCAMDVIAHIESPLPTSYEDALNLDRRVRDHPIPDDLKSPYDFNVGAWPGPVQATAQYYAGSFKDMLLIYLHRPYFLDALRNARGSTLQHPYGLSMLAVQSAARRLCKRTHSFYVAHPEQARKVQFPWFWMYTACIVMGVVILERPSCPLVPILLRTLEEAVQDSEIGGNRDVLKTRLRCLVDSIHAQYPVDGSPSSVVLDELPDISASDAVLNMLQVPQYGSARWRGLDVPPDVV